MPKLWIIKTNLEEKKKSDYVALIWSDEEWEGLIE